MIENILDLATIVVALAAVCVSAWSVWHSYTTQMTGAYFSEMTAAFAGYLRAVNECFYTSQIHQGEDNSSLHMMNALSASLCQLQLFATPEIDRKAVALYQCLQGEAPSLPEEKARIEYLLHDLQIEIQSELRAYISGEAPKRIRRAAKKAQRK